MPPSRGRGAGGTRKQQQPRRTHNLGGCSTCRHRHVKCDRTKPKCEVCRNANLECGGFPSPYRWASMSYAPAKDSGPDPGRNSRGVTVGATVEASSEQTQTVGEPESSALPNLDYYDPQTPTSTLEDSNLLPNEPDAFSYPSTSSFSGLESIFDASSSLAWDDLFDPTFDASMPVFQDDAFGDPLSLLAHVANQPQPYDRPYMGGATAIQDLQPPPYTITETNEAEVFKEAQGLLKHFRDNIIPQYGPLPMASKSPWEILNWSNAIHTLAEMTFLGSVNVKHANKANLFAILGCSAHHINKTQLSSGTPPPLQNTQILDYTSKRAKKHMQESLRLETSGPQKAKYKDQVMAIISLIALSTMSGNSHDARCYVVDAERLLRVRGLAKRDVSRRARLLHHVYTWLRIIGESTFVLHDHSSVGLQTMIERSCRSTRGKAGVPPTTEQNATAPAEQSQLDDFLRVELYGDSNYDPDAEKNREIGLRDIHLEDPRPYRHTLYMEIYGIPEIWLSLVSQTTRVANIMDVMNHTSSPAPPNFAESLQKRTARLEHMICSFAAQYSASRSPSPPSEAATHLPGTSTPNHTQAGRAMLCAMSSALVIFFYCRIRNVHPWILQGHVKDVIKALKEFDLARDIGDTKSPGTSWPAFIAGCEAMSKSARDWLMTWMQKFVSQSASSNVTASQQVMQEVWKRRDAAGTDSGKSDASWVDVLRQQKCWLMLY